jgi:hypothetical protein
MTQDLRCRDEPIAAPISAITFPGATIALSILFRRHRGTPCKPQMLRAESCPDAR